MSKSEAFSRVLIDQALKDSDWDLLDETSSVAKAARQHAPRLLAFVG